MGAKLEDGRPVVKPGSFKGQWADFTDSLSHNLQHPLALLLAQIITIILVAKLLGWICRKIGQPTVVGEMIAGILLGPSLLGMYLPEFSGILFPNSLWETCSS
ncbi:cation:proton antiporter [Niabella sp. W65]|nr:cation:proton antiporter [Niabella sp. W65]MCH7367086.1 cation:proton antiporter [Niabella sp. W65]ULT42763.1 cation:proton antiporter [Niabella sp. I65]